MYLRRIGGKAISKYGNTFFFGGGDALQIIFSKEKNKIVNYNKVKQAIMFFSIIHKNVIGNYLWNMHIFLKKFIYRVCVKSSKVTNHG